MRRCRSTVLFLALFTVVPIRADAPGVFAITGGTVHPVSGPEMAGGMVVIRDGLIEAVGVNAPIPPDATIVDVKGAHVYPGLIDAQTSLGFPSVRPVTRQRGGPPQPQPQQREEPLPETSPSYLAIRNLKLSDDDMSTKRATGVATIATAPSHGIFNGESVVLNLGGGSLESRAIKSPAALQVAFNPRPTWTYPDSLMGVIAFVRQTLLDAQQYAAARAIYERNPSGYKRPEESADLEALAPVLRRELPVVFTANSDLMIRRAQALARELNLRYVIAGGRQAYRMADELKAANVPVLVSVKWPAPPTSKEDREEQPLRMIRDRQLAPTSPAVLQKAGVQFALVSGAGKTGDFLPGIRKAIENGLAPEDALRAVTISPARILGVDRQLGSLEKGKIANLVITDKPIFDKQAKITRMYIDGREVKIEAEEKKAPGLSPGAASPIEGTWDLTVRASKGDVSIRATFQVEDGKLIGTFTGDRGSGDIRNGSFDGTTLDFTITVTGEQEAGDWVFHGTLRDSTLEGAVTTNLGTFQFTGRKSR